MNDLLEQATVASRAGDNEKAHLLLARLIKQEPRNAQAWYLLSAVVDNPEQQLIFTRRALAIDPGHAEARQQLAQMVGGKRPSAVSIAPPQPVVEPVTPPQPVVEPATPPQPVVELETPPAPQPISPPAAEPPIISPALSLSSPTDDFLTQAQGDTVPDWLAEDGEPLLLETTDAAGQPASEPSVDLPDLPDWLQEEPEPGWSSATLVEPAPTAAPELAKAVKPPAKLTGTALTKAVKAPAGSSPDWTLIGLSLAAVIVFIFFVIALAGALF
jgi:hypothetical protein